ncbi:hypothetical protein [Flavobacterium sp. J27]|uniref:hypothetical protein n=1 Tax=Flavobacterium sp. J27 TaxID=2060419 RepID=UPI00103188CD|nr:hypothetical protein [Flavobacterium sp. J27]
MEHLTFVNFVCLIGVIPLIIFVFNKRNNLETKYLLPFIILMAFGGLYELFGYSLFKGSTKYWFRIYTLLEFYTVLYFYGKLLKNNLLYLVFGILYFLLYFYLILDWSPSKKGFDDLPLTVAVTLLVIVSSFLWFLNVFKKIEDVPLYKRTSFYYISSFLIYFTGTFLVFIMGDYMFLDDSISRDKFWIIIVIFGFFLRLTLIFTVWKARVKLER